MAESFGGRAELALFHERLDVLFEQMRAWYKRAVKADEKCETLTILLDAAQAAEKASAMDAAHGARVVALLKRGDWQGLENVGALPTGLHARDIGAGTAELYEEMSRLHAVRDDYGAMARRLEKEVAWNKKQAEWINTLRFLFFRKPMLDSATFVPNENQPETPVEWFDERTPKREAE